MHCYGKFKEKMQNAHAVKGNFVFDYTVFSGFSDFMPTGEMAT